MNNNRNGLYSKLFIPIYILVFLLPILPLLGEAFLIKLGENYTLIGLSKELLTTSFIFGSTAYLLMTRRNLLMSKQVGFLLLFLLYGFSHMVITTASFSNAVNNFRLLFLNVVLCIFIIFLYLNKKVFLNNRLIFNLIIYSAICVALFGLYEKFINPDIIDLYKLSYSSVVKNLGIPGFERVRIASTLGNPINLGLFLVVGFTSTVYIMNTSTKKISSGMCFMCLLLFGFVSIFTLSRTVYGSFLITIIVYVVFKIFTTHKLLKKLLLLSAVTLILFILYIIIAMDDSLILLRLYQLVDTDVLSVDPRLEKWNMVMQDLSDNLMYLLWGFGLGNSGTSGLSGDFIIIENSFVSILYELGIVGLLLFGFIIVRYLSNTIHLFKSKDTERQLLGLVFLSYLAIFLFASLFIDAYVNSPFNFYFWLFFALSEISCEKMKKDCPCQP
jgi:O-antigen ligase